MTIYDVRDYQPGSGKLVKSDGNVVNAADGYNDDGSQNEKIIGSTSQDLGLNVTGTNMAAGTAVYGAWVDNVEWVRNIVLLAQSDQQYDLVMQLRDNAGTTSADYGIQATNGANSSFWRTQKVGGAAALCGHSVRFGIKNSSASTNTFASVRVQLLGL